MSAGDAVVVRVTRKSVTERVIAKVETATATLVTIRVWMGRAPFLRGSIRWSHTSRGVEPGAVLRAATSREIELGHPA